MTYDPETDTVVISLRESDIEESDEVRPGVIADFDSAGDVVRFEVLNVRHASCKNARARCSS